MRTLWMIVVITVAVTACSGGEPFDPEAARAEIEANWETFFDATLPLDPKVELLEDGELLRDILVASAENEAIAELNADVTDVTIGEDEQSAEVSFDLRNGEAMLLPGFKGTAVLVDGTWKVDSQLFCDLQALANNFCPELPEDG